MEYAGKAGRPLDGLDVKSFFDGLVFFGPVALLVTAFLCGLVGGCGAWAARAIGREGLCVYSTENIE